MSSVDAYNKVEELIKKCEKCGTEELINECKQYSRSISVGINNVYTSAQDCKQSTINNLYLLGKISGELSLFAKKHLNQEHRYEIEGILAEIRKIIDADITQYLQKKCRCIIK
jgi:hypothetical protein